MPRNRVEHQKKGLSDNAFEQRIRTRRNGGSLFPREWRLHET
jgi:hypothetical protein